MTLQELLARASGPPPAPEVLRARVEGSLLGLAAGNMLGVPVEFAVKADLLERYPYGVRDIDARLADGPWDDDLAQAIILAEAIRDRGELDPDDLAARLIEWRRDSGHGIGALTAQVIDELESGTPPSEAARAVWEASGQQSAGNGAVMRCAPVAMRWWNDGARLIEQSLASTHITHADPRCAWSTAVITAAIALLIAGEEPSLEQLARAAVASGAPESVADAIAEIDGADINAIGFAGWDQGYTLKAMQVGLWCVQTQLNLEAALVEVVTLGGDADTNGAVAGAVLGARYGVYDIPHRWRRRIPEREYLTGLALSLIPAELLREIAGPGDWRADPMPEARATLALDRRFTDEEMEQIRAGVVPRHLRRAGRPPKPEGEVGQVYRSGSPWTRSPTRGRCSRAREGAPGDAPGVGLAATRGRRSGAWSQAASPRPATTPSKRSGQRFGAWARIGAMLAKPTIADAFAEYFAERDKPTKARPYTVKRSIVELLESYPDLLPRRPRGAPSPVGRRGPRDGPRPRPGQSRGPGRPRPGRARQLVLTIRRACVEVAPGARGDIEALAIEVGQDFERLEGLIHPEPPEVS